MLIAIVLHASTLVATASVTASAALQEREE